MSNSLPSLLISYARILLHGRPGLEAEDLLPALSYECSGLRCDAGKLADYARACGLAADAQVPLLFPQVLAMPLQMRLIGDRRIPVKALGLVHVRNHVQRFRHLPVDASFDLRCRVLGHRRTKSGLEIDLGTELWCNDYLYWQAVSTYLRRGKFVAVGQPADELPDDRQWRAMRRNDEESLWTAPAKAGWQFAAISGDYNLIHVSDLAARSFGFPQAIAHGMWVAGRSLAGQALPEQVRLDVRFSAPVLLGMQIRQQQLNLPDGAQWQLLSTGDKPRVLLHARLQTGVNSSLFCSDR